MADTSITRSKPAHTMKPTAIFPLLAATQLGDNSPTRSASYAEVAIGLGVEYADTASDDTFVFQTGCARISVGRWLGDRAALGAVVRGQQHSIRAGAHLTVGAHESQVPTIGARMELGYSRTLVTVPKSYSAPRVYSAHPTLRPTYGAYASLGPTLRLPVREGRRTLTVGSELVFLLQHDDVMGLLKPYVGGFLGVIGGFEW